MEEKLKVANGQSGDSEARLFRRCQELQAATQEKDEVIAQLEQQLEEQVEQRHGSNFITAADVDAPKLLMSVVEFDSRSTICNRKYLVDTCFMTVACAAAPCVKMTCNSIFGDVRNEEQRGDLSRVLSRCCGTKADSVQKHKSNQMLTFPMISFTRDRSDSRTPNQWRRKQPRSRNG